ncbi:MAG: caspase domain-containing protein [Rubrivivax sp.]
MKQHPPSHSPDHGEVTGPVADTPAEPQPGAAAVPGAAPAQASRRQALQRLGAVAGLTGLQGWAAWQGAEVWAQSPAAASTGEPPRLALLIGNREYPGGDDLPPIHKNVRDLRQALEQRGFTVTDGVDLDLAASRALVARFVAQVQAAPPDSTVFFYFSGHGAQVDAQNLLVSARISPKAQPATLVRGSMTLLQDVVTPLPRRPQGLTIAVVDACRTSLVSALHSAGMNQVEAPPGCLIAFATGAGRPAIAPADDTRNTFYTGSLVKLLNTASDEISFSDLFRLVKLDVQQTMLNHPVPLLRQFAQFPFIAENTQVSRRLAPVAAAAVAAATPAPARFANTDEAEDWKKLEAALWPAEVNRLAESYLKKHPQSRLAGSAEVAREGAAEAAKLLRRNDVKLFRSAFLEPGALPEDRLRDLAKAGRGDKDAAARLGRWYANAKPAAAAPPAGYGGYGAPPRQEANRYEGWMQYAAALGNGIASYELALYYRRQDQPLPAAQYEARAQELGYTPPPSLDNTRK